MMDSIERSFKAYKKDGLHPFFFFYEVSDCTTYFERIRFLSNHTLDEFTLPGIPFYFPYESRGFDPNTLEELIYAQVMQPICNNQTEIVDFFRSDINALERMLRSLPVNMQNELLAYVTGGRGIYHYDEEPLYLVPLLREPKEILYFRTTDMMSPIDNRSEILCVLTEKEKKALDGKAIFNRKLGKMAGFDYLGLYDGKPCVFSQTSSKEEWFMKYASVMKEVLLSAPSIGDMLLDMIPFVKADHQEMNHILRPFERVWFVEDEHFKFGDFTDYYRKCILSQAMNRILAEK